MSSMRNLHSDSTIKFVSVRERTETLACKRNSNFLASRVSPAPLLYEPFH